MLNQPGLPRFEKQPNTWRITFGVIPYIAERIVAQVFVLVMGLKQKCRLSLDLKTATIL
jgi:hypothetical protein